MVFFHILSYWNLEFFLKLILNHFVKILKDFSCIRFVFKQICVTHTGMIIYESNKPSCTRYVIHRRGAPHIIVQKKNGLD